MLDKLEELKQKAALELGGITEDSGLEAWRVRYLGKKSELTQVLRGIAALPLEEKKTVGAAANDLRVNLEAVLEQKKQALAEANMTRLAMQESIDITLPGRPQPHGRLHPLTQTLYEISDIFVSMGFGVVEGPDVEWNYYNFEALNIPHHHPARDSMSTFWVDTGDGDKAKDVLLRTHTTAVDIRVMEKIKPPIRIVIPGRVYRYEASDATHTPMFHQIDGLAVGKNITMADLKGTLYEFSRRYFGADRKVRFRCDYFPFVEPGVEMAVECGLCRGAGCRLCGNTGWIEIAGAGMTHPDVLRRVGLDPEEYASFAFGMGIDRLPMLRYGIDDIRLYFGSDLRFLKQF